MRERRATYSRQSRNNRYSWNWNTEQERKMSPFAHLPVDKYGEPLTDTHALHVVNLKQASPASLRGTIRLLGNTQEYRHKTSNYDITTNTSTIRKNMSRLFRWRQRPVENDPSLHPILPLSHTSSASPAYRESIAPYFTPFSIPVQQSPHTKRA